MGMGAKESMFVVRVLIIDGDIFPKYSECLTCYFYKQQKVATGVYVVKRDRPTLDASFLFQFQFQFLSLLLLWKYLPINSESYLSELVGRFEYFV
jgi:hypothetical protein